MRDRQPNVLLLVVDACRFDYLRGTKAETPNADALAEEGTDFRRAVSPAPWTLPSMTSMLTGRYPHEHGANSRQFELQDGRTVTADLREAGYQCLHLSPKTWIGDWLPQGRGFHRVEEFTGPNHRHFEGGADVRRLSEGVARGAEWYVTVLRRALQSENSALSLANVTMYKYAEMTEDAWLDDVRASERAAKIADRRFATFADSEEPFFAYAHLMDPHLPFYVPEAFRSSIRPPDCESYEEELEYLDELMDDLWQIRLGERRLSDAELDYLRRRYTDEVEYADAVIGQILDSLEHHGLADDTLVVLTADHGEHLGEGERRTLLDHQTSVGFPLLRVPLVIRSSAQFDAESCDELVQTTFIPETIRAVAGLEYDSSRSLLAEDLNAHRGGNDSRPRTAIAEYAGVVPAHPPEAIADERLFWSRQTAVTGEWKLDSVGDELRAHRIDWPANETEAISLDAIPERERTLLTEAIPSQDDGSSDEGDRSVPEDVESNLRELGYL